MDLVDLAGVARSLRDTRILALVLVVNAIGIAYGFYYYVPQFANTPVYLWPLVPDSPMAVGLMTIALGFVAAGRSRPWLNLLGSAAMIKVGLWTAVVLAWFPEHFSFSLLPVLDCPTGTLGCGNLNTILFYGHIGMAMEALIVVDQLPTGWRPFAAVGGLLALHDVLDYSWPVDYLGRGCNGIFPHTVPCDHLGATFLMTLSLTLGAIGALAWASHASDEDSGLDPSPRQ